MSTFIIAKPNFIKVGDKFIPIAKCCDSNVFLDTKARKRAYDVKQIHFLMDGKPLVSEQEMLTHIENLVDSAKKQFVGFTINPENWGSLLGITLNGMRFPRPITDRKMVCDYIRKACKNAQTFETYRNSVGITVCWTNNDGSKDYCYPTTPQEMIAILVSEKYAYVKLGGEYVKPASQIRKGKEPLKEFYVVAVQPGWYYKTSRYKTNMQSYARRFVKQATAEKMAAKYTQGKTVKVTID